MFEDEITRREAMEKVARLVFVASGMSAVDLSAFLSSAEAASGSLKALKVQLSGFNKQVFESQYGRTTPLVPASQLNFPGMTQATPEVQKPSTQTPGMQKPSTQTPSLPRPYQPAQGTAIRPGSMGCMVAFGMGGLGAVGASSCGDFTACGAYGGGSCSNLSICMEHVCSGDSMGGEGGYCPLNDCNGQDCSGLNTCGSDACADQKCPKKAGCTGVNKPSIVSMDTLTQFQNDPYVQDLMRYLGTTSTQQLASQVENMIRQRRFITPTQLQQGRPTPRK